MAEEILSGLPFYAKGLVVHGFGRGSKQLGIPTGDISRTIVHALHPYHSQLPGRCGDVIARYYPVWNILRLGNGG